MRAWRRGWRIDGWPDPACDPLSLVSKRGMAISGRQNDRRIAVFRRLDRFAALFDPSRHGPRTAGFLFGVALSIGCMSIVSVAFNGGLSDAQGRPQQVYFVQ